MAHTSKFKWEHTTEFDIIDVQSLMIMAFCIGLVFSDFKIVMQPTVQKGGKPLL